MTKALDSCLLYVNLRVGVDRSHIKDMLKLSTGGEGGGVNGCAAFFAEAYKTLFQKQTWVLGTRDSAG